MTQGANQSPAFRECDPGQMRKEVEVEEKEANGMHLGGDGGDPAWPWGRNHHSDLGDKEGFSWRTTRTNALASGEPLE